MVKEITFKREGYKQDIRMKTIILGFGNPLRGDDGIGIAIVQALLESSSLPDGITVVDAGTSNLEALLLMQGYQRAFIIDAADFGGVPGEWRCMSIHDISFIPGVLRQYGSYHNAGLKDAIALGQSLRILPEEIFIYAVQPQDLQLSVGLSQSNSAAVREITKDLLNKLESETKNPQKTVGLHGVFT
jgi:hydrogenase maturation protease